jgi:hypothetical protein
VSEAVERFERIEPAAALISDVTTGTIGTAIKAVFRPRVTTRTYRFSDTTRQHANRDT